MLVYYISFLHGMEKRLVKSENFLEKFVNFKVKGSSKNLNLTGEFSAVTSVSSYFGVAENQMQTYKIKESSFGVCMCLEVEPKMNARKLFEAF